MAGIVAACPSTATIASTVAATALVCAVTIRLALAARYRLRALWAEWRTAGVIATGEATATEASTVSAGTLVFTKTMRRALTTSEGTGAAASGASNGAELDVRELDSGIRRIFLNVYRITAGNWAGTAVAAHLLAISGECGVQPEHVCIVVIPEGHHKHDTICEGRVHGTQTSHLQVIGAILGVCNPVCTEAIGDGVVLVPVDGVLRVLNDIAILGVELPDLLERASVSVALGDELGGHRHWVTRIDLEIRARSPEIVDTKTV